MLIRRLAVLLPVLAIVFTAGAKKMQAAGAWYANATTGNDGNSCLSTSSACKTITGAVNKALSGDTINVSAGTYIENVVVSKSLAINGAGQSRTIVEPSTSDPTGFTSAGGAFNFNSTVFLIQASNVTISNLTINGDNPGLTSGVTCGSNMISNGGDAGGWCKNVDFDAGSGIFTDQNITSPILGLTVHDVTIKNVYYWALGTYSVNGTFNFYNNTVEKGADYSYGIFESEASGTISNNTILWVESAIQTNWTQTGLQITGNTISHSNWGILDGNTGSNGSTDTISGNSVSSCWGVSFFASGDSALGIFVFAPFGPVSVSSNTVSGCWTGLASFASNGASAPLVTFSGNTVNGQNAANSIGALITTDKDGYGCQATNAAFSNNLIENNSTGFYTDETNLNNWSGYDDCSLPGGLTMSANFNSITNIWQSNALNTIDATHNYWGAASGPTTAQISGATDVTVFPWITTYTNDPAHRGQPGFWPIKVSLAKMNQAPLTVNVTSPATYGTTQTLTTSGGSGTGAVTYSVDHSTACSVSGSTLKITRGTGTCSVTATKVADANYNQATSSPVSVTVQKATTTISISNIPGTAEKGRSFTPKYNYVGDGTPSVTSSTLGTCTVSKTVVKFINTGTCTLTPAATAGTSYAAVTGSPQSFTITN